jgi:CO/xanthine dehydrogenase Mo-binding subunit
MDSELSIQQAAEVTGLSAHTLRYYERIGLLDRVGRAESGHRRYVAADLAWLDLLMRLRATGMPIRQMQEFAALRRRGPETARKRRRLLVAHRQTVRARIQALEENMARLDEENRAAGRAAGWHARREAGDNPEAQRFAMHAFGAQFAEARVNQDTGEVRVPRLLGVFAAGRVMNAKTVRSQLLGGMTMGLSMALHEASVLDPRFGDFINHDFAAYHIATNADVGTVDVWIDEDDPYVNPMGAKGIGEIGIVGTAAAIANAVYHATGVRVRDLPITLDKLLS